jgi:hypothetical protein
MDDMGLLRRMEGGGRLLNEGRVRSNFPVMQPAFQYGNRTGFA